jgi:uncharacterized protein (TIGR02145 family)
VLNTQPTADVVIGLTSNDTTEGTVSPSSMTFTNANWNSTQTVTVTGVNDDVDDGDISYSIVTAAATSSDTDYSGLNASDVSATNTDNDTAGITQSATSATIGEASTDTYTVVLDTEPSANVTVTLTSDDTSAATVTSSLTFTSSNWSSAQTVTITGVDDVDLDNETVTISHAISGGGYDSVTMTNFTATMTDDGGIVFGGLTYLEVTSDTTRVWLDRNLGATQVCTSSTDSACYGDLYQWGRAKDGHQSRTLDVTGSDTTNETTNTTMARATSISSVGAKFIKTSASPYDWTQNNTQDSNNVDDSGALRTAAWAVNDGTGICPAGFRVPLETELEAERASWATKNTAGAYGSKLKIPVAGFRDRTDGALGNVGSTANLWSRSADGSNGRHLSVNNGLALVTSNYRAYGFSVRCIGD